MRISILAAVVSCLLGTVACQTATVRGTEGRSLTATMSTSMTIHRGESASLRIGINRQQFTGPVTLSIFQLPDGVETDRTMITTDAADATFVLTAAASADLVGNHAMGVTVEGPEGRKATRFVELTVKN